jgi:hypothetical protein
MRPNRFVICGSCTVPGKVRFWCAFPEAEGTCPTPLKPELANSSANFGIGIVPSNLLQGGVGFFLGSRPILGSSS